MISTIKYGLFFISIAIFNLSYAGSITDAKITQINYRGSSLVVSFDKTFDSKCEDGGHWLILRHGDNENDRRVYALILAAAAAGNLVTVSSAGCDYHNTLNQFHVKY